VSAPAWEEIPVDQNTDFWDPFEARFHFHPSFREPGPAIIEPEPSVTIDLSPLFTNPGPTFAAGHAAVNAVALFAMTQTFPAAERLLVLDCHHPSYWFRPHRQALSEKQEWLVEVFPDGDYYAFLTEDLTEGTFGHPWEQTPCVFGPRLMPKLVGPLTSWLPIKRSRPPQRRPRRP
jgi:hypothetical protein